MPEQGEVQEIWEYRMVADRGRMHRVTVDELNAFGKEGWELITIIPDPEREHVTNFFFKRKLLERAAEPSAEPGSSSS